MSDFWAGAIGFAGGFLVAVVVGLLIACKFVKDLTDRTY